MILTPFLTGDQHGCIGTLGSEPVTKGMEWRLEIRLRLEANPPDAPIRIGAVTVEPNVGREEVRTVAGDTVAPTHFAYVPGADKWHLALPPDHPGADALEGVVSAVASALPSDERAAFKRQYLRRNHVDTRWYGAPVSGSPRDAARHARELEVEAARQQDFGNYLQLLAAMRPGRQGVWSGGPSWDVGQFFLLYVAARTRLPSDLDLPLFDVEGLWGVPKDPRAVAPGYPRWADDLNAEEGQIPMLGLVTSGAVTKDGPFGGLKYDIMGLTPIPRPLTLEGLSAATGRPFKVALGLKAHKLTETDIRGLFRYLVEDHLPNDELRASFIRALGVLESARARAKDEAVPLRTTLAEQWSEVDPNAWAWSA